VCAWIAEKAKTVYDKVCVFEVMLEQVLSCGESFARVESRLLVSRYHLLDIHTCHFISHSKPLGFGSETGPLDLTNTIRRTLINTYTHTKFKMLQVHINT
jgi:hypothetical protein